MFTFRKPIFRRPAKGKNKIDSAILAAIIGLASAVVVAVITGVFQHQEIEHKALVDKRAEKPMPLVVPHGLVRLSQFTIARKESFFQREPLTGLGEETDPKIPRVQLLFGPTDEWYDAAFSLSPEAQKDSKIPGPRFSKAKRALLTPKLCPVFEALFFNNGLGKASLIGVDALIYTSGIVMGDSHDLPAEAAVIPVTQRYELDLSDVDTNDKGRSSIVNDITPPLKVESNGNLRIQVRLNRRTYLKHHSKDDGPEEMEYVMRLRFRFDNASDVETKVFQVAF